MPELDKQPISSAPMDGTIIMGYWEDDPDPRSQRVRYSPVFKEWFLLDEYDPGSELSDGLTHQIVAPPTHWSPIN